MARRKPDAAGNAEAIVKAIGAIVLLLALGMGGITGFGQVLSGLLGILLLALAVVVGGLIVYVALRIIRNKWGSSSRGSVNPAQFGWQSLNESPLPSRSPESLRDAASADEAITRVRDAHDIEKALGAIDWYQFEKFCAALLESGGYAVERKGGAQPDGGVDLIASKDGERTLVQCKHWRTWTVQEKVVRELLGSMTHFGVKRGVIYTLKGWTRPAAAFAAEHNITLVDGASLSRRAVTQMKTATLDRVLQVIDHHCPRCEASMVWREGDFTPFWGCSNFPRCRAVVKHSDAR
jgi:hypothetical protein